MLGSFLFWALPALPQDAETFLTDAQQPDARQPDARQPDAQHIDTSQNENPPTGTPQENRREEKKQQEEVQNPPDARDRVFFSTETERIKPLARKMTVNIFLDQKDIWTSPLRIRSFKDALPWILVAGGTTALIKSDHWTARQLPNTVDQVSISSDISQVGAAYTVLPVTAGFYIGGAIAHNPKARETGVLGGESILDTLIVAEVLKVATRRQRPTEGDGNGKFFQGGSSFPSGHAMESWALASVVAHEYNENVFYPIAAYGLASLVSLSRLSGQNHFPSDVLVGSTAGWFIGRYVFQTHVNHAIHTREFSLRPRILPEFDGVTRGVVVSWGN